MSHFLHSQNKPQQFSSILPNFIIDIVNFWPLGNIHICYSFSNLIQRIFLKQDSRSSLLKLSTGKEVLGSKKSQCDITFKCQLVYKNIGDSTMYPITSRCGKGSQRRLLQNLCCICPNIFLNCWMIFVLCLFTAQLRYLGSVSTQLTSFRHCING